MSERTRKFAAIIAAGTVFAIAPVVALAAPPKATSTTLSTPLMWPGADANTVLCLLVNVSANPIDVTAFRIKNVQGDVLFDDLPLTVQPGRGWIRASPITNGGRCEFSFVGSPADVRGSIQLIDTNYNTKASADAR